MKTTISPLAMLRLLYLRRVVGTAIGAAGFARATAMACRLARGVYGLAPPARQRIEANLLDAYGHALSARSREALARNVFEHIARFWVETAFAPRFLRPGSWRRFVTVAEPEVWSAAAKDGRPAILVSTYFGNVAVGAYVLGQIFRPVHVVIDRIEAPVLRQWQDDLCRQPHVRLIAREDALDALPRILNVGGRIMVLGEHIRPHGPAIEVPFLGRPRRLYRTIGILAARHNARVVVFSCEREGGGRAPRFTLRCHDRIDPAAPSADIPHAVIARYAAALEGMIRDRPEQYLWTRHWDRQR